MTERAYTVTELIALRRAVRALIVINISQPYREAERTIEAEAIVQTHMLAGHVAEDLQRWQADYRKQRELCDQNRSKKT